MAPEKQTYAAAGVDIDKADRFVDRLKKLARRKEHEAMWQAAGGYAAVYPSYSGNGIAVTTDGVGTKLLVAHKLKKFDTIGIDLVAMCANDLICVGATPNIFLDYFAVGKLDDSADAIMAGIVAGCDQTGMLLVGGETAEMPGVYEHGHFDLAGFAVGQVRKEDLLTGAEIAPGQKLIGVASSGIHSNGLSLARKVLPDNDDTYNALLTPTLLYVKAVMEVLEKHRGSVKGIAHITGGGWTNLFRLNGDVGFVIDNALPVPAILKAIGEHVNEEEMYKTFNMGMGLALIVDETDHKSVSQAIIEIFEKHKMKAQAVGHVTERAKTLTISNLENSNLTLLS
ncbi:phosphoribosylformylglycinamidine cyclo-ligase [bacterium]|jgi:phosphoribosylformylglycinamidine cyclo-ligase|nr:phosphoribosylformylglycinamidine cyclo-ligase [bacterium]